MTISYPQSLGSDTYRPNSLPLIHDIIRRIRKNTDIPIPESTLDISCELVPFHCLLSPASPIASSSIVPLSTARKSGMLTEQDVMLVDLQLGKFLGQMHSGVQNDWFGSFEVEEPKEPSYSWQETFTSLLETLMCEHKAAGTSLPYEDIRRYLSRAIGFFLFDDADTPSLIWLTGSEDDIFLVLSPTATKARGVVVILPSLGHALWGDPLLETFFKPPAPSAAFLEGYTTSGGGQLTLFPRQKTKRIWYTLFLGLLVLKERSEQLGGDDNIGVGWARNTILECIEALKNAPCY